MEELLKDWVGTIAILIYLVYPLLKRWQESRRKKREQAEAEQPRPAKAKSRKRDRRAAKSGTQPAAPGPTPRPEAAPRPTEPDFLAAALAQVERLKTQASRLLARAEGDPRLARLVPAR